MQDKRKGSVQSKRIWQEGRNIQGESQCRTEGKSEIHKIDTKAKETECIILSLK